MRSFPRTTGLLAGVPLTAALGLAALAQTPQPPDGAKASEPAKAPAALRAPGAPCGPTNLRVYRFVNAVSQQEQNEILTAVRNTVHPSVRVTITPTQGALVAEGTDDELAAIQKIVEALDKPKRSYRLTYTLVDFDGAKRLGDQHYSMTLVVGQRTSLKQGNKVPIVTGMDYKEPSNPQTHVTYLDIGMNFDATLDGAGAGLQLRTKVEQSSVIGDRPAMTAIQDPVLRQSVFEGSAMLTPGKAATIGTLDIVGTTRRVEIQAIAEPVTP